MRIVIKVGTSTIAHRTGRLNIRHMESLCKVISDLKNSGEEIILVSSGAIGMGMGKLNLKTRPEDIPSKQAAAAVAQDEAPQWRQTSLLPTLIPAAGCVVAPDGQRPRIRPFQMPQEEPLCPELWCHSG